MSDTSDNPLGGQAFRSALAELLGTFFLALAALTIAAPSRLLRWGSRCSFSCTRWSLSGAHLNPAVTVGLVGELSHNYQAGTVVAEFLGFGILMITMAATTEKQVAKAGSGIAVGGALLAALLVSHGVLNPAVALAMGLATSPTIWATLLSAVVFSLIFSVIEQTKPAEAHDESVLTPTARADDSK